MSNTTHISEGSKQNFNTLVDAVHSGRICVMSVFDSRLNQLASLICAVNTFECNGAEYAFVPLAILCEDDPYVRFVPPFDGQELCNDD